MTKIKHLLTILVIALWGSGAVYATDKELVNILVDKGFLTQDEASKIMSDVSHGPIIKTKGKLVEKLTFNGRVHGQWDYLSADIDNQNNPSTENSFIMRRLYLGAKADLGEGWQAVINASFGDDNNRLDKGYISKKLNDELKLYVGYLKAPFGIEETTSSTKIKSVERTALNRTFIEDFNWGARVTGLQLHGSMAGFKGAVAVTNIRQNNFDDGSDDGDSENSPAYWGRLNYTLPLDSDESAILMFGGDVGFLPNNAAQQYASNDLHANSLKNRDAFLYTLYGKLSVEDFISVGDAEMLVQLMGADLEDAAAEGTTPNADDASPIGFSIIPSIFLAEDLELVLSYSFIDSDGVGVDPGDATRRVNDNSRHWDEYQEFYIGFNYYIRGNDLKLSFGYVYAEGSDILSEFDLDGDGDNDISRGTAVADEDDEFTANGFRARLQLLF